MSLTIYQVDAFTDKPFAGNPAAVCILPQPGDAQWMQQIATEMNLSETAFLYKQEDGFSLRWFTPAVEVDLCGHATLASAHIVWETGHLQANEQARFFTRSGLLTAERKGDWIEMDFPAKLEEQTDAPPNLLQALGLSAQQIQYIGKNVFDYLVEVASEDIVRSLHPNFTLLSTVRARGVMVTSRASMPGYDFVSRFFGPSVGVNEDPVTGSAHSCLTPYWSQKLGKQKMVAYQASPRGGILRVRASGNRVQLGGQAVTVLRGELMG